MKLKFFSNKILVLSLLSGIGMAAAEVPLWISIFALVMITWRFAHEKWQIKKIPVRWTPVIGAALFGLVYLQYKTIFGQEESTIVLLGLISLTILNYEFQRDHFFIVLLGFLLIAIKSIFSIDLVWVAPGTIAFFGLWASLVNNGHVKKPAFLFWMTLRSLPLFAVLMIAFPRFVVFQTKRVEKRLNKSGFSENLNPGHVAELALQNAIVFRADFKGRRMEAQNLYWRGAVLTASNGLSWRKAGPALTVFKEPASSSDAISYSVVLDMLDAKNVFVLETPMKVVSASKPVLAQEYNLFALPESFAQELQYEATASFSPQEPQPEDQKNVTLYVDHPELPSRAHKLMTEIKQKYSSLPERTRALNEFFSAPGFIYTLKPDYYKNDLDEFLFVRKKGFCEHFAAAYATLSRALGIPTRVVVGYQGGLYNRVGQFWTISQRDAHAWVEILEAGHWRRIDPTGFISPLRLTMGGSNFFSLSEEEQRLYARDLTYRQQGSFFSFTSQLESFFENLNYQWTLLLLNYDLQSQLALVNRLKGNWAVVGIFALIAGLFWVLSRRKSKSAKSYRHDLAPLIVEIETWAKFRGLSLSENATPIETLSRLSEQFPAAKEFFDDLVFQYERLVYREIPLTLSAQSLRRRWRNHLKHLK